MSLGRFLGLPPPQIGRTAAKVLGLLAANSQEPKPPMPRPKAVRCFLPGHGGREEAANFLICRNPGEDTGGREGSFSRRFSVGASPALPEWQGGMLPKVLRGKGSEVLWEESKNH